MNIEMVNNLLTQFKKEYLNTIESDYSFLSENDKKNFPFYKAYDYLGLIILNIGKINEPREYIFVITNNIENQYIKETQINTEDPNFKKMIADRDNPEEVAQYLLPSIDFNNKKFSYVKFGINYELKPDHFGFKGKLLAKEHYDEIYKDKSKKIMNNNKPSKNPFSFLDFETIMDKVNDDDFKYQMNEAKICYENQLYLAATCTFSVCLETVLMIILEKNNLKVDDDSTMLNKIGDTLRNKNIISKRANNRLLVTYSVRNSTSHTNKNKVIQNDCEWILKTIEFFVDEYID
ncbi:hypothetical protein [Staphylococcus equorum]|uniref:hypothetical protein n=1 Tax=Staphylococcus equorum TaxID=246432 RepID=UPI003D800526